MRVATRIGAGSAVLAAIVVCALGYELTLLRRMADANRDLSTVTFRTASLTVEQLRTLDDLEEHTNKFAITSDAAYGQRVSELREAFVATLYRLERLPHSDQERVEVARLVSVWEAHPLASASDADIIAAFETDLGADLVWADRFATLRVQGERVLVTAQATIATRVGAAAAEARRATRLAWTVGAAALGLTLVLGLLLVRSITRPLRRLSEGTRAVAAGELTHHVPPAGDDEFAELTERFNVMTEKLAKLDRVKKDLLSRVSHDLKTPLATMIETTRLLRDQVSGPLNAKQRRLLDLTIESGGRLAGMISKLLDLSGLEAVSAQYARQDTNLADLVRAVTVRFEGAARERDVTIETHGLADHVSCRCDPDRLTSVIENLMENALKFAPPHTTVDIDLHTGDGVEDRRPASWRQGATFVPDQVVMITVADRGPGVAERQKERIFQKFHQAEATPGTPRSGIGLGLAICREIVEAHDGAIWVEDNVHGGSVFYLMLPTGTYRDTNPASASSGRASASTLAGLVAVALLAPACATAMRDADRLFDQGRYDAAIAGYERMLNDGASDTERARARYRLALLFGSLEGDTYDPVRARALLEELAGSASGTPYVAEARVLLAAQARVERVRADLARERDTVTSLETQLAEARTQATEARGAVEAQEERVLHLRREIERRDARVTQLERELERLKQIDLRGRPRE